MKAEMQREIMPNNILMIGSTGVGKTEIARRLAKLADAPFVKVEASKFTEVGYVGRDVESMIRDLAEQAVAMIKTQKKKEVEEKAAIIVEDIILDALIPPTGAEVISVPYLHEELSSGYTTPKAGICIVRFFQKIKQTNASFPYTCNNS